MLLPLEGRSTYCCHWKEGLHIVAIRRKIYILLPLEGRATCCCHWKKDLHIVAIGRKIYILRPLEGKATYCCHWKTAPTFVCSTIATYTPRKGIYSCFLSLCEVLFQEYFLFFRHVFVTVACSRQTIHGRLWR